MLITCPKFRQSGFSLVELMVGVLILGLLTALAFPGFQSMLRNSQVRNAAEAITNGLQRARAEAVSRNTDVAFALSEGSSWQITLPATANLIESRSSNEGSKDVTVTVKPATTSIVTFSNLGTVKNTNFDGSQPVSQFDLTAAGSTKSLRVTIGVGGNAKMCDPSLASGGPSACN